MNRTTMRRTREFTAELSSHGPLADSHGRAARAIIATLIALASLLANAPLVQASSYDLRLYDRVTPVKDQNPYGNCWSYAALSSIESNMLTRGYATDPSSPSVDYSESHLSRFYNGYDTAIPLEGGGRHDILSYIARGRGPVLESLYPFPGNTGDSYAAYAHSPQCWVTAQQWIDPGSTYAPPATIADIQNAIAAHGAVATSMYWDNYYYNSSANTYYYSGGTYTNHAVSLVGWDDSKTTQGGQGAWLVKNSWGTWLGDGGYFWLSYNDTAAVQTATSYQTAKGNAYSKVYENQTNAPTTWWGISHGASRFETDGVGFLEGIGFATREQNVQYTISVYDSWSGSAPSGLLATKSGIQSWPGYYVVDLDDPILLDDDDEFVVAVEFSGGLGSGFYWAADTTCGDPSGLNYISNNGSYWYDAASALDGNNVLFLKTLVKNIPGDANRDGTVDGDDAAILDDHWGDPVVGWAMGDFDGDGMVGASDASILAANWGYNATEALNAPSVPEPGTMVLILCTSVVCFLPRRRRE